VKQLYELLESIRSVIAEKLLSGYSLVNTYKAVVYAFVYTTIQRTRSGYELLKPLERRIPSPLIAAAKRELVSMLHELLKHLDLLLTTGKPVLFEEAYLEHVVEVIKNEVGSVNYVLVYDCMSVIEQLAISAFLKVRGVRSVFLSKVFINPIGLTRFVTQQLSGTGYRTTLLGLAQYVANRLNASLYRKNPFVDEKVHEVGLLGIDEFVDSIPIDKLAHEILEKALEGRTLVFSDHGYDLVVSPKRDYLYVTHGFREPGTFGGTPLLPLSRITLFMGAYRAGGD